MKKTSMFFLVTVFALALCFSPAQAKTINLKLSYHFPPVAVTAKVLAEYVEKIEKETNGRVKIKIYPSATLHHVKDAYEAVKSGISDMTFTGVPVAPHAWPLNQVFNLPAVGVPMGKDSVAFYKEAWKAAPELAKEMSDIKVLMMANYVPETYIHTSKKLVRVPDDIKGMKMIGIGAFVNYIKATGANAVNLMPNDFYAALERGVAEGVMFPSGPLDIHGLTELVPYHLTLDLAAPLFMLFMNLDKWNAISSEDKEIINRLNEWVSNEQVARNLVFEAKVVAKFKKLGHTVTKPTPEEFKLWQDAGEFMLNDWIKKNEAKGRPAKKVFENVKKVADKYK